MNKPIESPESKESRSSTSLRARLLSAVSRRRGLFFGGVAIGLTLISFVELVITGIIITATDNRTGDPTGERSFALECLLDLLLGFGVVASIAAASAAIYGTAKELPLKDNLPAAGVALLGLAVSVPWCAWLLYGTTVAFLWYSSQYS